MVLVESDSKPKSCITIKLFKKVSNCDLLDLVEACASDASDDAMAKT